MYSSFDSNGRPYAHYSEVYEGTVLIADGGFCDPTEDDDDHYCIKEDAELVVKLDKETLNYYNTHGVFPKGYGFCPSYEDCLYVDCDAEGEPNRHYINGQLEDSDDGAFYMGFYLKES